MSDTRKSDEQARESEAGGPEPTQLLVFTLAAIARLKHGLCSCDVNMFNLLKGRSFG